MWIETATILAAVGAHSVHIARTHRIDRTRHHQLVEALILLTAVDKTRRESIEELSLRLHNHTGNHPADHPRQP